MKKIDVSLISLRPEKDHEEKRKREGSQMVGTGEFTSPRRGRRGIDVTRSANPLLFLSIDRSIDAASSLTSRGLVRWAPRRRATPFQSRTSPWSQREEAQTRR